MEEDVARRRRALRELREALRAFSISRTSRDGDSVRLAMIEAEEAGGARADAALMAHARAVAAQRWRAASAAMPLSMPQPSTARQRWRSSC